MMLLVKKGCGCYESNITYRFIGRNCGCTCGQIAYSVASFATLIPFTLDNFKDLSDERLGYLDLFTNRFVKLQDVIGSKIFPVIFELLQENKQNLSALDRLHALEKLEIIDDSQDWVQMRNARNMVAHEYPTNYELIAKNLEDIRRHAEQLLHDWDELRLKITEIKQSALS